MMNFISIALSTFLGFLTLNVILSDKIQFNGILKFALSLILGLGLSSIITFYSFFIFKSFNRWGIIITVVAICLILTARQFQKLKNDTISYFKNIDFNLKTLLTIILHLVIWISACVGIHFIAMTSHPFGEWDAWALWNMKTKFLALSGSSWMATFKELHWHTQPDYPVLMPFMNIWSWAISQNSFPIVCRTTAMTLTLTASLLLYGSLKEFTKPWLAFLASCLLLICPYFLFLGTAQYADILLAVHLLSAIVIMLILNQTQNPRVALLLGTFLGLLSFTKNEGIVMGLFIFLITLVSQGFRNRKNKDLIFKIIGMIILGSLITGLPTLIFKIFIAPPNRDIGLGVDTATMKYFNLEGLKIVYQSFIHEITHRRWSLLWPFIGILFITAIPKMFRKDTLGLTFFFILYSSILVFIYLTTKNFDLAWRLKSSLGRILFYILPTLLFFLFYMHWSNAKDSSQSCQK